MIRFFRTIRQKLLSENRFSKYLLYAIGEIILVVIGILLALYINNQNQLSNDRQRVDILLEKVLLDLEQLIYSSRKQQKWYAEEENILKLILDDRLTYDDYANSKYFKMFLLTYENRFTGMKRTIGYDNLFSQLNNIPAEYDSIMNELTLIYHTKSMREIHEARVNEITKKNRNLRRNFEWFSAKVPDHENKEMIDFLLYDVRYKNEAKEYFYEISLHKNFIKVEKKNAIESYKDICAVLGKPLDSLVLGYNTAMYEALIGDWHTEAYPTYTMTIFEEGNVLKLKDSDNHTVSFEFLGDDWMYDELFDSEYQIMKEDSVYKLKTVGDVIWEKVEQYK